MATAEMLRQGPAKFYVRCSKQGDSALWRIKAWGGNRIGVEIQVGDNYTEQERQIWFGGGFIAVKFDEQSINGFTLAQLEQYRNDLAWFGNMLQSASQYGNGAVTYIVDMFIHWEYVPELRPGFYRPGIAQDFTWDKPSNLQWATPEQKAALGLV